MKSEKHHLKDHIVEVQTDISGWHRSENDGASGVYSLREARKRARAESERSLVGLCYRVVQLEPRKILDAFFRGEKI